MVWIFQGRITVKQLIIIAAVAALAACGKKEDIAPVAKKPAPTYESAFRECIDRNTDPNRVPVITFKSPEEIAEHCEFAAKTVMKDVEIRATARQKYL